MENPNTWGPVERLIGDVLDAHDISIQNYMTGLSRNRKVADALRSSGFIPSDGQVIIPLSLLSSLYDSSSCYLDHNGECQAHGFMLDPGEICPQQQIQNILEENF